MVVCGSGLFAAIASRGVAKKEQEEEKDERAYEGLQASPDEK